MISSDYEYDVFVSYSHSGPIAQWVVEMFVPLFKPALADALNRSVRVFMDVNTIRPGDDWQKRIKRCLAHSKCLVGIWSPTYFNSEWCTAETAVMLHREQAVGYRTLGNPTGLVLPIKACDGESFPDYAKAVHHCDCSRLCRVGDGFKKTVRYVQLQDVILDWAESVAAAVSAAPPWNPEWLTESWLETPVAHYYSSHRTAVFPPPVIA